MAEVTKACECCEEVYTREVGSNKNRAKFCSKGCAWKHKRLLAYKISFKDMRQMVVDQNNQCAICFTDLDHMDAHAVHIDHDHKTGAVRGILCQTCNRGLGQFKDDVNLLLSAIEYLEH